ncbi:mutarotase [Halocella sp. SP3-1]|uniref:mutarotase n=1 Tax=Halocella sp. SP3-1 TaxID=2382161 RepID=UPI000F74E28C|nr:mutarotase [Halocella sp. SP3-1]AZO94626.1 mutarotase [Halocella sp. SP3-1]
MNNIQMIYNSLWKKSSTNFRNNIVELDNNLNRKSKDKRRGISLIGRLDSEIIRKIMDFLGHCQLLEPDQYYYQAEDIHLTILSIISCYEGFKLNNFPREAYGKIIAKSINEQAEQGPIKISFQGITASPSCIMVQGFPQSNRLKLLRECLRDNFKSSSLENSIDQRYKLETAHSTVIRFKKPLASNKPFLDHLKSYREYDFGDCQLKKLDLVYNDWYMSSAKLSQIKTFQLE